MSSDAVAPGAPELTGASEPVARVDQVADAVLAVPGVHTLHAGLLGEVATYLPGRRVQGIRLGEERSEVHLVLDWDAPVARTTEDVRAALAPLVEGPIDLSVEDVAPPPEVGA